MSEPIEEPTVDPDIVLDEEETYEIVEDPTPVEEAVAEGDDVDQALELLDFTGGLGPRIASVTNPEDVDSESQIEDVEEDNVASETAPFLESEPLDWEVAIENANAAMRVELDEIQKSVDYSLENNSMYEVISEAQNRAIEMGEEILQAHDIASQATLDAQDAHNAAVAAQSTANAAQNAADAAQSDATQALQDAANAQNAAGQADSKATAAQTSANSKNTVVRSTSVPSATHPVPGESFRNGDLWWRWDNDTNRNVIGQWAWKDGAWVAELIGHQVISSMDVNKLVVTGSALMSQAVAEKILVQGSGSVIAYIDGSFTDATLRGIRLSNSGWTWIGGPITGNSTFWLTDTAQDTGTNSKLLVGQAYRVRVTGEGLVAGQWTLAQKSSGGFVLTSPTYGPGYVETIIKPTHNDTRVSLYKQGTASASINKVEIIGLTGTTLIEPGSITTSLLRADAIDGMTMTAGIFRTHNGTDPTLGGIEIDTNGFRAYRTASPTRELMVNINSTSGTITGMTITGGLIQTTSAANRGIKLTSDGFVAYDAAGNVSANINSAGGAFTGYTISGGTITGALLQTRAGVEEGIKIDSAGAYFYDDGSTNRGTISFYLYGDLSSRFSGNGLRFWYDDAECATVTSGSAGLDLWSKYWVSSDAPEVSFAGNLFNVTSNNIVLGDVTGANSLKIDAYTWTASFSSISFLNANNGGLTVSGLGVASLRGTTARVEVGTDVILRTDASVYIRKTASNVSPLSPSNWQVASPLMLDGNGRMYQWENAPQRPVTTSSSFPSGTTWTPGQVRIWTASYSATSPSGAVRDVLVNFTNFPGGSANLNIRRGVFSSTSCTVYVVNTGNTTTTLGGDLGVQASVLV